MVVRLSISIIVSLYRYYPCCEEPYPDLTFTLSIMRISANLNYLIVMPAVMLSPMNLLVFFMPPSVADRSSYGASLPPVSLPSLSYPSPHSFSLSLSLSLPVSPFLPLSHSSPSPPSFSPPPSLFLSHLSFSVCGSCFTLVSTARQMSSG